MGVGNDTLLSHRRKEGHMKQILTAFALFCALAPANAAVKTIQVTIAHLLPK